MVLDNISIGLAHVIEVYFGFQKKELLIINHALNFEEELSPQEAFQIGRWMAEIHSYLREYPSAFPNFEANFKEVQTILAKFEARLI